MKVLIDIPTKNFGVDITNKFQDFFQRLQVETKAHLISNTNDLCGNYELETIEMFLNAFEEMQIIPDDATNGDMIKAMFPNVEMVRQEISSTSNNIVVRDNLFLGAINRFHADWWNAPYKRGDLDDKN